MENKIDIFVFADWHFMEKPKLLGVLSAHLAKGKKAFSFEYDKDWLKSNKNIFLDPDIQFFSGPQFPYNKENFGVFQDCMPDTWGRTLMKRRAAQIAKLKKERTPNLYDIDFLLGVFDECRMGALRFKKEIDGPFLDNNLINPTPPWSSIRKLQAAVKNYEEDDNDGLWLDLLIAPGSSLGGARPKANIVDENNELWIAKFPSKNDTINKAAWEYLAYLLAINCGVKMSTSKIEKVTGTYHTFFTKRFDRNKQDRIHFSSAMTMTGNNEDTIKDNTASYLDIAEFIQTHCVDIKENLHQLWKRIVFNISISNTDDHLRTHGFLLSPKGWNLSPAFDLNPSIDKNGLALNIDSNDNELSFDLAKSVGEYFQLSNGQMDKIIKEVLTSTSQWAKVSKEIGIPRKEIELMQSAFQY